MTIVTRISQEVSVYANWNKLSEDIKEKFNIPDDAKDIELFLSNNEKRYLQSEIFEGDTKVLYISEETEEESEEDLCSEHK